MKDGAKAQDSGHQIAKLERILEKEKKEFEVFSTKRLLAPFSFFTDCGLLSAFPAVYVVVDPKREHMYKYGCNVIPL